MPRLIAALLLIAATSASSGCLVLSLSPLYAEAALGWDLNLIGVWESSDDKATVQIGSR